MPSSRLKQALGFCLVPVAVLLFSRGVTVCWGDSSSNAQRVITEDTARRIVKALDAFGIAHHRLPTVEEGLAPLLPDYLDTAPSDAWGHSFAYVPSRDSRWADVISYGRDGEPGGSGAAADISGRFGSPTLQRPVAVDILARMTFLAVLLVGVLGSRRSAWAAGMLAGTASLFGLVLLATVASVIDLSLAGGLTLVVVLSCLTGSIAVLWRAPGSSALTTVAALCAYVLLGNLIAE
jgi:general secretion pathway protein G